MDTLVASRGESLLEISTLACDRFLLGLELFDGPFLFAVPVTAVDVVLFSSVCQSFGSIRAAIGGSV